MSIDVVIVNWNSGQQIRECIDSLSTYWSKEIESVIVVDNGSTDGSDFGLEANHLVKVIRAGENLGFGKACNLGASAGHAEFILFLNPDTRVFADSIVTPFRFMLSAGNSDVGVCGIKLINAAGSISRSCTRFPSGLSFVAYSIGLDRFIHRLGYFMHDWDHASDRAVDHVIGAFYFIRRSLFESLRGFDERFFVYLEDLDLSKRVRDAGWRVEYLAGASAFHAGGGVSDQVKAKRLFYSLRSRILYAQKNLHVFSTIIVVFSTMFLEPLSRTLYFIIRGSISSIRETWSAQWRLIRWLAEWAGADSSSRRN